MAAPVVVAKGYDAIAQRIMELVRDNGVMLVEKVENVALARGLAKEVAIGHPVPTKWHQTVAAVLSLAYKLKSGRGRTAYLRFLPATRAWRKPAGRNASDDHDLPRQTMGGAQD
jgi:flagellar biosynthesis protein FlhB